MSGIARLRLRKGSVAPAVPETAPANTVAPAITGTATVGQTLTCSNGSWTGVPTPTYAYQWLRGGSNIGGATAGTYTLVAADYNAVITCTVTATNSEGSASATSAGTSAVAGLAPVNTVAPGVSGTPQVGETLTGIPGTWTGVPTPTIETVWLRNGAPISGATASTYELVEDDEGAMIAFEEVATNAAGSDWAMSDEVGPVEAAPELRRYPTLLDPPATQYPEITQAQPGYLEPVQFGGLDTVVVRVTDANNQFHHYSTWQAFTADQSTLLINTSSGGRLLDLSDWSLIRTFGIGAQVCFCDPVDPDLIWGHDGHGGGNGIYRYSIANNDNRRIAITGYTGISIGMGEGSMSADGRYMILCALKSGDSTPWVLVFDTSTETVVSTLNLTGWEYSGSSFDNAHISPSGNYVIVASYQSGSRGHRIYDRATLTYQRAYTGGSGTNASTGFPGHMDIGYRTNGDECMVRQRSDGALVSVRLSDGNERVEVAAAAMSWANHVSCRNTSRPGYAYISMLYQSDQSSKYLYREVCAVRLDGSGSIERFGQAMFPANTGYALQAKATVSPHGDIVLMTSGWGTTTPREYVMYAPEVMP